MVICILQVTKKLADLEKGSANWATDISNEHGEILNCVLTMAEGEGLRDMAQGIVRRYNLHHQPPPLIMYVDRDCCSSRRKAKVLDLFQPWECDVRLDIWHFLRRISMGVTTECHILYASFMTQLTDCVFEWDKEDTQRLMEAKRGELVAMGRAPTTE